MIATIDFETTGLKAGEDEVLQVSIIDENYNVLLNAYCRPNNKDSWEDAQAVHGITPLMVANSLRSIWRDRMVYRNKEGYADPTAGAAIHEAEPKVKKKEYNPEVTNLVSVLKQMIDIAGYEMVGRIVLRDKDTGKEYR